ncbi:Myblike DNAbinding domain-containing protein [Actinomortierella wolfii]|nr:Myblike DNAbinding domain-containing protein [Actinomortierella wolfii]
MPAVQQHSCSAMEVDGVQGSNNSDVANFSAIPATAAGASVPDTLKNLTAGALEYVEPTGEGLAGAANITEWMQGIEAQINMARLATQQPLIPTYSTATTPTTADVVALQTGAKSGDGAGSTVNDNDARSTFVPIPFHIVQLRENERVRNQFRQNTQNALLLNRRYQQNLIERFQDIQRAKQRLNEKRSRFSGVLNSQERRKDDHPSVANTDIRIDPPYFIDSEGNMGARSIRTGFDCYIQWMSFENPTISNEDWSKDETKRLLELVEELQGRDWNEIARRLGTKRTAAQCFRYYHIKGGAKAVPRPWTEEEDMILTEAVNTFGENSWNQVSEYLDGRSAPQCLQRWVKGVNPVIRRGRWTSDEDAALKKAVELIEVDGKIKWTKVQDFVLGRTDVQCRERYMNVLAPNISYGFWDEDETNKLLKLVEKHGTSKWALIASEMGGRTDNQCWRRWKVVNQGKDRKRHWHPDPEDASIVVNELKRAETTDQSQQEQPTLVSATTPMHSVSSAAPPTSRQPLAKHHPEPDMLQAGAAREGPSLEDLLYQSYLSYKSYLSRIDQARLKECHHLHSRESRSFENFQMRWRNKADPVERIFNLGIPKKCFAFREFNNNYLPVQYSSYELRGPLRRHLPYAARMGLLQNNRLKSMLPRYHTDERGMRRVVDTKSVLAKMKMARRTDGQAQATQSNGADVPITAGESPPLTMEEVDAVITLERLCRMRPVPPCVSTVQAFSILLRQGRAHIIPGSRAQPSPNHSSQSSPTSKRFQVPKRVHDPQEGVFKPGPVLYDPLSFEEQQTPEFQELMGRFEAVFLWPMLSGMLHMGAARKIHRQHTDLRHVPGMQSRDRDQAEAQGYSSDSSTDDDGASSSDSGLSDDDMPTAPSESSHHQQAARKEFLVNSISEDDESEVDDEEAPLRRCYSPMAG